VVFNKVMDAKSNLIALQNREDFSTEPTWIAKFQCPTDRGAMLGGRADIFAYFNNDVKGHAIRNAADQNVTS